MPERAAHVAHSGNRSLPVAAPGSVDQAGFRPSLVVIGGHSRNIGKTSLACGIIAATEDQNWTAVKITLFGHGICSADGKPCSCAVDDPDHPFVINEEHDVNGDHDTGRMLAAGARRVLWVRAPQGSLADAIPGLRERLGDDQRVLIESNSIPRLHAPRCLSAVVGLLTARLQGEYGSLARSSRRPCDSRRRSGARIVAAYRSAQQATLSRGGPDYCSDDIVEFVRRSGGV